MDDRSQTICHLIGLDEVIMMALKEVNLEGVLEGMEPTKEEMDKSAFIGRKENPPEPKEKVTFKAKKRVYPKPRKIPQLKFKIIKAKNVVRF